MRIKVTSGGKTWEFAVREGGASVTVGRRGSCDIVVEDTSVSDLHVRIDKFMNVWNYTDQMSDAGTLQNGESRYSGELKDGDVLKLGNTTLTVLSLLTTNEVAKGPEPMFARQAVDAAPVFQSPVAAEPDAGVPHLRPESTKAKYDRKPRVEDKHVIDPGQPTIHSRRDEKRARKKARTNGAAARDTSWQAMIQPSKPKGTARAGPIVGIVVVIAVLAVVFGLDFVRELGLDDEQNQSTRDMVAQKEASRNAATGSTGPDKPVPPRTRLTSDEEKAYRELVLKLQNDSDTPPHERLAALDAILQEVADLGGHMVAYYVERAQTSIGLELSAQMQRRYGRDNGDIYDLQQKNDYHQAHQRLEALAVYLAQSVYHEQWAKRHDMNSYIERERPAIASRNERWIGEQCGIADEALARDAFSQAAATVDGVVLLAVLDDDIAAALGNEASLHRKASVEQDGGERPPARAAFDRRKDRLPPAPESPLLPQGENSSARSETRVRTRLLSIIQSAEFTGMSTQNHGREATVTGYDSGRVRMMVKRPILGRTAVWEYVVLQPIHAIAVGARIRLYEQLPELTQNERVATLMLCFEEGLLDDATRVACSLRNAHPEHAEHVDKLLATKLRIDVPEGGFIEKDGRLVAPE